MLSNQRRFNLLQPFRELPRAILYLFSSWLYSVHSIVTQAFFFFLSLYFGRLFRNGILLDADQMKSACTVAQQATGIH